MRADFSQGAFFKIGYTMGLNEILDRPDEDAVLSRNLLCLRT